MGIIACVEATTTTTGTTPQSTSTPLIKAQLLTSPSTTPSTAPPTTSGTTVTPTTVQTTPICQKDMAVVGGPFVSSVSYSVQPVPETNNVDLTSTTGNGVTFPSVPNTSGLVDKNNIPLYNVTMNFYPPGADSLASVGIINTQTNVKKFSIRFFVPSYPNQPFTSSPEDANNPLYYESTIIQSTPTINNFPPQVPSPLSGILITILSTNDNK